MVTRICASALYLNEDEGRWACLPSFRPNGLPSAPAELRRYPMHIEL